MLKISPVESVNCTVVLRLEGRVVGPWVGELQKSCEEVLASRRSLKLHLADLVFLDRRGVALLLKLRSQGVAFLECPPFAAEQLKTTGRP